MSKKKDSVSGRLKKFIALEESKPTPKFAGPLGLLNSDQFSLLGRGPFVVTAAEKKAFKTFGLEPRDPDHRDKLLFYFAEAHYGDRKIPIRAQGRPRSWNRQQLRRHLVELTPQQRNEPYHVIAALVRSNHRAVYQHRPDTALEREIGKILRHSRTAKRGRH